MFGSFPGYGGGFNPFLHSSYIPERQYYPGYGRSQYDPYAEARARAQAEERARALAQQRARRSQWLPDEDEDEDDWESSQLGPRERAYLEAMKRRQQLEQQERQRAENERSLQEQRWQKQLEEKQREEDARRQKMLAEQRRIQQQKREQARRRAEAQESQEHRTPSSPRRIPIAWETPGSQNPPSRLSKSPSQGASTSRSRTTSPHRQSPTPHEPTPPPRQPTPRPQYNEKHEEAATIIQTKYRIHQSLKHIRNLEQSFLDTKQKFTFPTTIDFQRPGAAPSDHNHITVPVRSPPPSCGEPSESPMEVDEQAEEPASAKLAYTSNNYVLHAYSESLLKLLMQLDGVESWGDSGVRNRRRAVVKEIEGEVARLDAFWKKAWKDHLNEEGKSRAEVDDEMREEGKEGTRPADENKNENAGDEMDTEGSSSGLGSTEALTQ